MSGAWRWACLGLLLPLLVGVIACGRGSAGSRLVGAQLAASSGCWLLLALTFAFEQASSFDLALTTALLALPGTLTLLLFFERWL